MEAQIAEINRKLDGIVSSQTVIQGDIVRLVTRLDIIDNRGSTASVEANRKLEGKIEGIEKNLDRKIFGAMTAAIGAMATVIWSGFKDGWWHK